MIRPIELQQSYPIKLSNGAVSTTLKVWDVLLAAYKGDLSFITQLASDCPEIIYAQYNYTPPIYFAVREGHRPLVEYLLQNGAHQANYKTYPFQEPLQVIARDRGFNDIADTLDRYALNTTIKKFSGDNGEIDYQRSAAAQEFEQLVDQENLKKAAEILKDHPEFALDRTFFWSEGILLFAAKEYCVPMMEMLMQYGAKVPDVLKWTQYYYFERTDSAKYLLEHGMNPDTMSWHHVTILHDMAQKGFIDRAELLINHGADINAIDEEYRSTPLGMAVRWGQVEMVNFLISKGADANISGASWSVPIAWARTKNFPEIEKILVDAGARI